ncbi:hypothetical protein QWJ34_14205 [Saccharibacillus sp. CPCC 101409]|uniref:hypothetical protein n=1 Tax=Saccharibacillus sp. CPCC 101409 TaxID=3058041 RepID=UPI0026719D89|nr:hypothetical protein [Saccharibacillus sp. CPCC 101409]MDO3410920.1 hypothetical protein [Saccharibacillus sp. CPCC 101409]
MSKENNGEFDAPAKRSGTAEAASRPAGSPADIEAAEEAAARQGERDWLRRRLRRRIAIGLAALLGLSGAALALLLVLKPEPREVFDGLPGRYTYLEAEQPGQPHLYMMAAAPDDIVLRADDLPLRQIPAYGINGGFFYEKDLLSIAVMNDEPVNGKPGGYGSGWFNEKYARGTLVWDGAKRVFSVQVVSSADELDVPDRNRYFAQGGVSLNLNDERNWLRESRKEKLPFADEARMRSALVYNDEGKLWLIVTPTACTASNFRAALLGAVPGTGREGIFLDGDGSSQMNAAEAVLTGDSRKVVQMISISAER